MAQSAMDQRLSHPDAITFRWIFPQEAHLCYSLNQSLTAQKQVYFKSENKWLKGLEHIETLSGDCEFRGTGDGSAHGILTLKVVKIQNGDTEQPLTPDLQKKQKAAEFILHADGSIDPSDPGIPRDTLLLLRLLFGLPETPLKEHEGKTFAFRKFTQDEVIASQVKGAISYLFEGFETIDGYACAFLSCQIDLQTTSNTIKEFKPTVWKGTGKIYFAITQGRIQRMDWKIAKKLEIEENKKPSVKYIEIISLDSFYHLKDSDSDLTNMGEE
ncbi:hypothetical protein JW979_07755 [bacterium]|nr:hypothetical protein [candidate division CSSED10-310 bacterium]